MPIRIPIKAGFAATAAAALLCVPAASFAAYSSADAFSVGGTTGASTLAVISAANAAQAQTASGFLTQAVTQTASAAQASAVSVFASDAAAADFVQSAPAMRNPLSSSLRGNSDLFLWNLVAKVRAHQVDNPFDLVDSSVAALQIPPDVTAVPLPGAIWLFVMGVLGLAGTRITGITGVDGKSRQRNASPPVGAAVAA